MPPMASSIWFGAFCSGFVTDAITAPVSCARRARRLRWWMGPPSGSTSSQFLVPGRVGGGNGAGDLAGPVRRAEHCRKPERKGSASWRCSSLVPRLSWVCGAGPSGVDEFVAGSALVTVTSPEPRSTVTSLTLGIAPTSVLTEVTQWPQVMPLTRYFVVIMRLFPFPLGLTLIPVGGSGKATVCRITNVSPGAGVHGFALGLTGGLGCAAGKSYKLP
jgi:hypothetical protein